MGVAVNIVDLIPKHITHPFQLIQRKIIALAHVIHPVSDAEISLGHPHILVQVRK
jgi:hypothetical protein